MKLRLLGWFVFGIQGLVSSLFARATGPESPATPLSLVEKVVSLSTGGAISLKERDLAPNIYDRRRLELEELNKNLQELQGQRDQDLRRFADLKNQLLQKQAQLVQQDESSYRTSELILLDQQLEIIDGIQETWKGLLVALETHIAYFEEFQDLLSPSAIQLRIFPKERYFLEDLIKIDNEIASNIDLRDSSERLKLELETSKNYEESNLENLNKELSDPKWRRDSNKRHKAEVGEEKGSNDTRKGRLIEVERDALLLRIRHEKLKLERTKQELAAQERQHSFLKFRYDQVLRPNLNNIRERLEVGQPDIDSLQGKIDFKLAELSKSRDQLGEEIKKLKDSKAVVLHRLEEVRRQIKHEELSRVVSRDEHLAYKLLNEAHTLSLSAHLSRLEEELLYKELCREDDQELDNLRFFLARAGLVYALHFGRKPQLNKLLKTVKEDALVQISKSIDNLKKAQSSTEKFLLEVNAGKNSEVKAKRAEILEKKSTVFQSRKAVYQDAIDKTNEAERELDAAAKKAIECRTIILQLKRHKEKLLDQYKVMIKEVETDVTRQLLWERSPSAITWNDLKLAYKEACQFVVTFFWECERKLWPGHIFHKLKGLDWQQWGSLAIFLLLFMLCYLCLKFLLGITKRFLQQQRFMINLSSSPSRYLAFLVSVTSFIHTRLFMFFVLFFQYAWIAWGWQINGFSLNQIDPFYLCFFYFASMVVFVWYSFEFVQQFGQSNDFKDGFLFDYQIKNEILLSFLLYSAAFFIPLRYALIVYSVNVQTMTMLKVFISGYSLLLVLVFMLLLDKNDILTFLPMNYSDDDISSKSSWASNVWHLVDRFYYPIFFFIMGFLVLAHPCLGYVNLAWFLLFVIPLSLAIIWLGSRFQYWIKYGLQEFLLSDEDGDSGNEGARSHRLLYGTLLLASFFIISLTVFVLLFTLWGIDYGLADLWCNLSYTWTIPINGHTPFGVVQILVIGIFIASGLIISSLFNRFILGSIFEIFCTEPGLQNTISKVMQYIMILLSIIMGCVAIGLTEFISYVMLGVGFMLSFGVKDQIADIFAGFVILLERQVEIGHFIQTDGIVNSQTDGILGTVHRISLRSTTIRTARNFFVSIPNRLMISKAIINWGAGRAAVGLEFVICTDTGQDPEAICVMIKEVIYKHPSILHIPTVTVRLDSFVESGMQFFARAFVSARRVREQWDIASDIRMQILKAFKNNGIKVPYPVRTLYFANKENKKDYSGLSPFDLNAPPTQPPIP